MDRLSKTLSTPVLQHARAYIEERMAPYGDGRQQTTEYGQLFCLFVVHRNLWSLMCVTGMYVQSVESVARDHGRRAKIVTGQYSCLLES